MVKRKRGRQSATSIKATLQATTQDSQDSTSAKSNAKETPGRKCSLCYKDKSESLVPCRDCTVRGNLF